MAASWTLLASNFGSAAATTITVAATLTAGRALHIAIISDDTTISSVVDTLSNTYTSRGSVIEAAITRRLHNITAIPSTGGSTTITVTFAASVANRQIAVYEGTGITTFDASNQQTDTGSNPTGNVSATNTAQPATCHATTIFYQGGTPTVGTGYTDSGLAFSGSGMLLGRGEYKSVTNVGVQTANFGNAALDRQCTIFAIFLEPSPPTITVQPVQQTVASGATATFNVTATDVTSYQWQINVAGTWTNVSTGTGGTTASYTTGTLGTSDNGSLYRCQVTNSAGTVNSAEVFVFLTNQPSAGKGIYGPHSSWARRFVRKLGNIRQSGTNFLRPAASRVPNKDNADLTTVWRNWFIPAPVNTTPTGNLSVTGGNDTLSATGTPVVVGNLSRTNQNDTLSSTASPVNVGTLARTNQNDTLSATASPVVVGTLSATGGSDTLSATGSVGTSADGTLNVTAGNDTLSSTGTPVVVGTLNRTNANDSLSSTATPVIVGNLSRTNANDTVVATGSVGSASTGTLNVNEQRDTLASAGTPINVANLNVIGRDDTLAATASPVNIGNLSRTEGRDTLVSSGTPGTPSVVTRPWRYLGLLIERLGL